jgi:hypothetical protein
MAFAILMIAALSAALLVPVVFGPTPAAMIAAHCCILAVSVLLVVGTLRLTKGGKPPEP